MVPLVHDTWYLMLAIIASLMFPGTCAFILCGVCLQRHICQKLCTAWCALIGNTFCLVARWSSRGGWLSLWRPACWWCPSPVHPSSSTYGTGMSDVLLSLSSIVLLCQEGLAVVEGVVRTVQLIASYWSCCALLVFRCKCTLLVYVNCAQWNPSSLGTIETCVTLYYPCPICVS